MHKKSVIFTILPLALATAVIISTVISTPAQTIEIIESKMDTLINEIDQLVVNQEELALNSNPYVYIENSSTYRDIIDMGVSAVKPLYDILYKSPDAGLYEYIVALAIQDITKAEYSYYKDYGWKNSLEFRLCYESKVNNAITTFEYIKNNDKLTDDEKIVRISDLGVFAISGLLDEVDASERKLSDYVIQHSFEQIVNFVTKSKESVRFDKLEEWRAENENAYRSLMKLNRTRYGE